MDGFDVDQNAAEMMRLHGEEAESQARRRADQMLLTWDVDGFQAWTRVVDAIRDLRCGSLMDNYGLFTPFARSAKG